MAPPTGRPTVFVVDEDDAVRDALTTALTSAGFATAAFRSAAEFIEAYRSGGPACLVIELELPDIDALSCRLPKVDGLPIILTSGRLRRRRLPDELAGCVGLLEKPFGHDELMVLLRAALPIEAGARDK
jgi:two-component system, LuxR family, response regulator FixJ